MTDTTPQLMLMSAMRFAAAPRVTPRSRETSRRNGASATAEPFTRKVTTEMVTSMAHGSRASAPGARTSGKRESFTPGGPRDARARL